MGKLFSEALQKEEIKAKLESLSNIESETSDINSVVTNILRNYRKWFNSDLYKMRKTLDIKKRLLAKHPSDHPVRGSFFKYRKMNSKSCKFQRRKYKADLIEKLDNLSESDPKAYWSLLDELKETKDIL